MFNPEFLTSDNEAISGNSLIQYLQEQSPDVLQRVARSLFSRAPGVYRGDQAMKSLALIKDKEQAKILKSY